MKCHARQWQQIKSEILQAETTENSSYQLAPSEEGHLGGVGVQADLVLAGCVRGESEAALGAVLPGQDHLQPYQ